jgi:hypothetical protein
VNSSIGRSDEAQILRTRTPPGWFGAQAEKAPNGISNMKASNYIRVVFETVPGSRGQLLLPVRGRSGCRRAQPQVAPYLSAIPRAFRDPSASLELRKLTARWLDAGGTRTVPARYLGCSQDATPSASSLPRSPSSLPDRHVPKPTPGVRWKCPADGKQKKPNTGFEAFLSASENRWRDSIIPLSRVSSASLRAKTGRSPSHRPGRRQFRIMLRMLGCGAGA